MNKYNSRTKIEEKKKQAAEMFRRFTMQIDSLEKEAVGKRRKEKSRASPENAGRKRLSYDRAAEKT